MNKYNFKFPELYQFFGGYFYQGWAADYRWENLSPNSPAVVSHFKAVNPAQTVIAVRNEIEELIREDLDEEKLTEVLTELGSCFYPPSENLTAREWLKKISEILEESPTRSRILRELR